MGALFAAGFSAKSSAVADCPEKNKLFCNAVAENRRQKETPQTVAVQGVVVAGEGFEPPAFGL